MMMAEEAVDGGDIFVYLGGEQEVPRNVTHVRIDRSVKIIPERAFFRRTELLSVETHDDLEKIERDAFNHCTSLRGIKLQGVRIVEQEAFFDNQRMPCRTSNLVTNWRQLETVHSAVVNIYKRLKCHLLEILDHTIYVSSQHEKRQDVPDDNARTRHDAFLLPCIYSINGSSLDI
jgi:hypothetical protein